MALDLMYPSHFFGEDLMPHSFDDIIIYSDARPIYLPRRRLENLYPGLRPFIAGGLFDLSDVAKCVFSRVQGHNIGLRSIMVSLRSLFGCYKRNRMYPNPDSAIIRSLGKLADEDLYTFTPDRSRCRRRFTTLAYFANIFGSRHLALILSQFFVQEHHRIFAHEHVSSIQYWADAVMELQRLLHCQELELCLMNLDRRQRHMMVPYYSGPHVDPQVGMVINLLQDVSHHSPIYESYGMRGRHRDHRYRLAPRARTVPPRLSYPHFHSPYGLLPPPTSSLALMPTIAAPPLAIDYPVSSNSTERRLLHEVIERQEMMEDRVENLEVDMVQGTW